MREGNASVPLALVLEVILIMAAPVAEFVLDDDDVVVGTYGSLIFAHHRNSVVHTFAEPIDPRKRYRLAWSQDCGYSGRLSGHLTRGNGSLAMKPAAGLPQPQSLP